MRPKRLLLALALIVAGAAIQPVYAAITQSRVVLTAQNFRDLATRQRELQTDIAAALSYNSSQSIDWANLDDADPGIGVGNVVEGEDFTAAEVSNAIGTLAEINTLLTANSNAHLGNLHKLASP